MKSNAEKTYRQDGGTSPDQPARLITLDRSCVGGSYRVIGVSGGWRAQSRLLSMGILPGLVIKVLQANVFGPVIIYSRAGKIALGRGVAHKVMLAPVSDGEFQSQPPGGSKQDGQTGNK